MRLSEDRYARDLRRIQLAHRMIRHEVRTYWICAFTQQTMDRVRNLLRSYGDEFTRARHRGAPPHNYTRLLLPVLHSEASALAGIVLLWRLIPPESVQNARRKLPSVELGEKLCKAFELFRVIVPGCAMTMDRLILLTLALAERQLTVRLCRECHAAILCDPIDLPRELCLSCQRDRSPRAPLREAPSLARAALEESAMAPGETQEGEQQRLF
jgi:hypothetical protein